MGRRTVAESLIMGLPRRFWSKTAIQDSGHETPCLAWTGATTKSGYGQLRWQGQVRYAHRVAYEAQIGPILHGGYGENRLTIDHLCRFPSCVNVDHMEVVTAAENIRRSAKAVRLRTTNTCPSGHPMTDENTHIAYKRGRPSRSCRTCGRQRMAQRRALQPASEPKSECPKGHPYADANVYIDPTGVRRCRTCAREAKRTYKARIRAQKRGNPQ